MDQTPEILPVAEEASEGTVCAHCGVPLTPANQPTQTLLCSGCREYYVRFPFPLWVKLFGGVVLLLLVVALFSLPHTLGVGIHYKRGETAEAKHNYLTAQRELEKVVAKEPSFVNAQCRLLIAAFYNSDLPTMASCFRKIEGKEMKDDALYSEVNQVIKAAGNYYPQDSFTAFLDSRHKTYDLISVADLRTYLETNRDDAYARVGLADRLFDEHAYASCDSLLNASLQAVPGYRIALQLKMPVKREMGQQDSSLFYADRLLAINHEDTYAWASKVKALLKQHKDGEALACAKAAYAINDHDDYLLGALALAYHFNRQPARRDAVLVNVTHDSTTARMLAGIRDIVSGKDKFRD